MPGGKWEEAEEASIRWYDSGMICFDCECGVKEMIAHVDRVNLFSHDQPAEWEMCDCGREYRVRPAVLLVRKKGETA